VLLVAVFPDRQTDRQTDRRTDGRTDREAEREKQFNILNHQRGTLSLAHSECTLAVELRELGGLSRTAREEVINLRPLVSLFASQRGEQAGSQLQLAGRPKGRSLAPLLSFLAVRSRAASISR